MKKIITIFLTAAVCGTALSVPAERITVNAESSSDALEMYRLYNPNSGEHFYTSSAEERELDVAAGWNYEGVGWSAPTSGTPVIRMYNPIAGEHHYTTSKEEADNLVAAGWNLESDCAWYSAPAETGVPVYREYNPNQYAWNHNYSTSTEEKDYLVSLGWQYEGISWYGVDAASAQNSNAQNNNNSSTNNTNPSNEVPEEYKKAVTVVQKYIDDNNMSKSVIYAWMVEPSPKGEGFSEAASEYAVNQFSEEVYMNEALDQAKYYRNYTHYSDATIRQYLKDYDEFTDAEIDYALANA